jgi:hypothetical protein
MQETHLRNKDRHYLRVNRRKMIFQANRLKKHARVDFFSNKMNFHPKLIKIFGEAHFIVIIGKIYLEDFLILDIYAPNARVPASLKKHYLSLNHTLNPKLY